MRKSGLPVLLLFLLFFQTIGFSKVVSESKAKTVAENFLYEHINSASTLHFIKSFSVSQQNLPLYYVFIAENGFILISANDAFFPVMGYGKNQPEDASDFPPQFKFWMLQYQRQITQVVKANTTISKKIKKAWDKYSAKSFIPGNNYTQVEPLIHTKWSQDCFYNDMFPADTNGPCDHVWVGCVATAMGQLMKYYNFPKNGSGTHSYSTPYGILSADFGSTFYNWTIMNYHVTGEDNAVAELLFHCAISVDSQIFPYGTGAWDFDARDAFVNYFGYQSDAQFIWRDSYSGDWKALLRSELDQHRPIIYGGVDNTTDAGHTFICDGYQDTDFFHFNWGWNGSYDGYYYIDTLTAGGNTFDIQHDAIVNLRPVLPEIIDFNPPENLTGTANANNVFLTWDAATYPGTLELLGYNVYRNNILINPAIINSTEYNDTGVPPGVHQYKVKPVYIGEEPDIFASTEVTVEGNGIADQLAANFEIYPNPVSDFLTINPKIWNDKITSVSVLNQSGASVYKAGTGAIMDNPFKIDLSAFASGIYILRITASSGIYSDKLVINH